MEKRPRLQDPPCVYKRQKLWELPHVYQRKRLRKLPRVYHRRKRLELPPDLIQQMILIRLPVKSLRRFRCVSKPWRSLIDDPSFQKQYAEHRASQSPLLLVAKNDQDSTHARFSTCSNDGSLLKEFSKRIPKSDRVDDNKKITFWLIGCCQGLICFRLQFEGSLHVCNPSTEEMISLPLEERKGNRPNESDNICVGFGYAASIKKFKVVKMYQRDFDDEQCSCKIFTLGSSDGWRKAEKPPYFPNWGATFLHGALHFLPNCDAKEYDFEDDDYIAAFDLDTEKYRKKILLPLDLFHEHASRDNKSQVPIQLAELRGSLFLAFELVKEARFKLELLFLEDYPSGKWVKAYMINLSPVVSSVRYYMWTTPLAILRDETILVNVCSSEKDEVYCYTSQGKCIGSKIGINCWAVSYNENPLSLRST